MNEPNPDNVPNAFANITTPPASNRRRPARTNSGSHKKQRTKRADVQKAESAERKRNKISLTPSKRKAPPPPNDDVDADGGGGDATPDVHPVARLPIPVTQDSDVASLPENDPLSQLASIAVATASPLAAEGRHLRALNQKQTKVRSFRLTPDKILNMEILRAPVDKATKTDVKSVVQSARHNFKPTRHKSNPTLTGRQNATASAAKVSTADRASSNAKKAIEKLNKTKHPLPPHDLRPYPCINHRLD